MPVMPGSRRLARHLAAPRSSRAAPLRSPHAGCEVPLTDDGTGGADPAGGGLLGLARRAAALDGRLRVVSPPGGPTTITAELPCLPPCA